MHEDVRIDLAEPHRLRWPRRCPRCGSTSDLVSLDATFVRDVARRRDGESAVHHFFSQAQIIRSDRIRVPVPACLRHARANQVGGALLFHGGFPGGFRKVVHASFLAAVVFVGYAVAVGHDIVDLLRQLPALVPGLFALGVLGVPLLAWARHVAWVHPVGLDLRIDVGTLRFRDVAYAGEFRRLNATAATNPERTQPREWWRRLSRQEAVVVGLLALLLAPIALVVLGVLVA